MEPGGRGSWGDACLPVSPAESIVGLKSPLMMVKKVLVAQQVQLDKYGQAVKTILR